MNHLTGAACMGTCADRPVCTGHVVYHGPIESTLQFFATMGFQCPERKGVADFLQEVTSKNDQQVFLHVYESMQGATCKLDLAVS